MEPDRIKELLEKYWQAQTDEAEEAELKAYFAGKAGLEDHPVSALFSYFRQQQQVMIADGFDEKFETAVSRPARSMTWLNPLLKVAAILLLVFSIIYILLPDPKPTPMALREKDTYHDPQKAYVETRKALLLISRNLNTASSYIAQIGELNKAEQFINTKADTK